MEKLLHLLDMVGVTICDALSQHGYSYYLSGEMVLFSDSVDRRAYLLLELLQDGLPAPELLRPEPYIPGPPNILRSTVMPSFKFHFHEIDWVIYVPSHGNDGRKYDKYGVDYNDRSGKSAQSGRKVSLKDVLSKTQISKKYPHTVGFFLASKGRGPTWKPDYLRTKAIRSKRGFHAFLKELSL